MVQSGAGRHGVSCAAPRVPAGVGGWPGTGLQAVADFCPAGASRPRSARGLGRGRVAVTARGDGPRRRRLAGGSAPRWARVRSGSRAARRVASGRVGALVLRSSLDATDDARVRVRASRRPRAARSRTARAPPRGTFRVKRSS